MKMVSLLLAVLFLSGVFSCKQLENAQFNVTYNTSVTVSQQPLTNVTDSIASPPITTNVASVMKQNNTSTNLIRSVTLQSLTLTITSPAGQTFGFLSNAQVYIFTDSLPPVQIANMNNVPDTASVLNMNITNAELKPYLLANNFQLKIIGTAGKPVTVPLNVNIFLGFHFVADLLAAVAG